MKYIYPFIYTVHIAVNRSQGAYRQLNILSYLVELAKMK